MIKKILHRVFLLAGLMSAPFLYACQEEPVDKSDEQEVAEEYPTDGPVKVEVVNEGDYSRIYRNGKPYFVKGGAYNNFLSEVPKYGGNSIRTYGVSDDTQAILDSALQHKLTVCLGLWVNRETDGFDYDNEEKVAEQKERIRQEVLRFKDHPAVLMWGIGNEVDARYTNYKVWNAIGDISDMIHELDTNHLTTTVLAGTDPADIVEIIDRAPSLDVLSVNSYNAVSQAQRKIASAGWSKPYLITEWGLNGTWGTNVPATSWGGLLELTSTEKGEVYKRIYTQHIAANIRNSCAGSYVFLWGYQTHGAVATWYGLFTRNREPLEAAHAMQYSWEGTYPSNRAPRIESEADMLLDSKVASESVILTAGKEYTASVKALDFEGDELTYEWQVVHEGLVLDKIKGRAEATLPGISGVFEKNDEPVVHLTMPGAGAYRLYAFVFDDHGNAASAVIPFKVEN